MLPACANSDTDHSIHPSQQSESFVQHQLISLAGLSSLIASENYPDTIIFSV